MRGTVDAVVGAVLAAQRFPAERFEAHFRFLLRPLLSVCMVVHNTRHQVMNERDLMAPDTEPTDEELALVMREARELAVPERAKSDAWIAARLKEAAQYARENARAKQVDPPR